MKKEKIIYWSFLISCGLIGIFLILTSSNKTEANNKLEEKIECVDTITLEKRKFYKTVDAYPLPEIRRYLDTLPDGECLWVVYYGWFKECFPDQCLTGYALATSEPLENESYVFKIENDCDQTIEIPHPELLCKEVLK